MEPSTIRKPAQLTVGRKFSGRARNCYRFVNRSTVPMRSFHDAVRNESDGHLP